MTYLRELAKVMKSIATLIAYNNAADNAKSTTECILLVEKRKSEDEDINKIW